MPARATSISSAETSADGTRRMPAGPAGTSAFSRPGRGFGAEDRHGSGVRHGRGDGPEADPLGDAEAVGELDDGVGHGPPAVVRLRADEHEEVAVGDAGPADHELGPGQLGEPAVDDLERGPAGAVVEERVRVEGRDDRGLAGDLLERGRGRGAGIDPAVERGEDGRGDEVARVVEGVQAHADRIGLTGRLPSPAVEAGAGRPVSRPAEDLAARDDEPAVGLGGPAVPRVGDPRQLLAVGEASLEGVGRECGAGHPVCPETAPPGAVVGRREAPRATPRASRPRTRPRAPTRGAADPRPARRRCAWRRPRRAPASGPGRGRPDTRPSRRSRCRGPRRARPARQTRRISRSAATGSARCWRTWCAWTTSKRGGVEAERVGVADRVGHGSRPRRRRPRSGRRPAAPRRRRRRRPGPAPRHGRGRG